MALQVRQIPIDKSQIPYTFQVKLAGETFRLGVNYNQAGDFFTLDLYRGKDILVLGEKMMLGVRMFAIYADRRIPSVAVVPWDMSERAERVGWSELGTSVQLYIIEGGA